MHCAFLYISKPSLHDQYLKLPNYPSWWARELKKNNFLFLSLKYEKKNLYNSTQEKKNLTKQTTRNQSDEFWNSVKTPSSLSSLIKPLTLSKLLIIIHSVYLTHAALPKSPSRLATANGPRTPFQTAKATGVIYSVPERTLTPPPPAPRSTFKATPPKGIRGSTVSKNGKTLTQDARRREQSPGEQNLDSLQPPVSASRLLR